MTVDLFDTLQHVWDVLCTAHDVTADLPTVGMLFESADPSAPGAAAEIALVNMLSEIMEGVGRFSPWYKRPASAFGILFKRGRAVDRPEWSLTTDALDTYRPLLDRLAAAIDHNTGVILATRFVDGLDRWPDPDAPCRTAACQCAPPRTILVRDIVIARAEIICDACRQPFVLTR